MDYKLLMNTAVLAGVTMLKSGAETYRVEETIVRILKTANVETVETVVLTTGIFVTLDNPDMENISVIKRVESRGTNLNRIGCVNSISRRYCAGEMTLEEAYTELKAIGGRQYRRVIYNLATIGVCAGFAPLFGGSFPEIGGAALAGVTLALVTTIGKYLRIQGFLLNVFSAFGAALTAIFLKSIFPGLHMDTVIISSIMPIVPGVAITYAIRDSLQGDYLAGAARSMEAFMTAVAIALGVGMGMAVTGILQPGGGLF
ncbi:threonine/serine exporter family protein [Mediterraneibacter agrestimuris]|uniref:threonine/serine exporter family protein n=1 Tax=Mediterraneibacter agrestimuris TaxID=2941333 RepID=UPI00203D468A|nr:threonine/serine exporter family protein [Mediterraneibacter agrestimuris]